MLLLVFQQINTYIGKNQDGYRSLFANVSAKTGEKLATITGASMINAGAIDGSFLVGPIAWA